MENGQLLITLRPVTALLKMIEYPKLIIMSHAMCRFILFSVSTFDSQRHSTKCFAVRYIFQPVNLDNSINIIITITKGAFTFKRSSTVPYSIA